MNTRKIVLLCAQRWNTTSRGVQMVPSPGPAASELETAGSNSMGSILESVSSFASITTTSGSDFRSAAYRRADWRLALIMGIMCLIDLLKTSFIIL